MAKRKNTDNASFREDEGHWELSYMLVRVEAGTFILENSLVDPNNFKHMLPF